MYRKNRFGFSISTALIAVSLLIAINPSRSYAQSACEAIVATSRRVDFAHIRPVLSRLRTDLKQIKSDTINAIQSLRFSEIPSHIVEVELYKLISNEPLLKTKLNDVETNELVQELTNYRNNRRSTLKVLTRFFYFKEGSSHSVRVPVPVLDVAAASVNIDKLATTQPKAVTKSESSQLKIETTSSPVSVKGEVSQVMETLSKKWLNTGENKEIREVQVIELNEVPGTYVAIFSNQILMNVIMDRASSYIEEGKMKSHKDHVNDERMRLVGGHDLMAPAMKDYWAAYQKAKPEMPPMKSQEANNLLKAEDEFWTRFILPTIEKDPKSVVLAVSVDTDYDGTLSHEILHAQYFKDKAYNDVVDSFWETEVTANDKAGIKATLSPYYDSKNEELMKNEFQAYMLMNGAFGSQLAMWVKKYRDKLMQLLDQAGVQPIQWGASNQNAPFPL
jgi:hypothetical protein